MADEHLDRLESFRVFIQAIEEGFPVPPVNSDDLKRLHEMSEYVSKEHPGSDGALSIDLMTGVCTPEANVPAVWFRHARLRALARQGVLAAWQRGSKFDDVVYRVAATIPMSGLRFDQEDFLQRLLLEPAA